jgi:hypothetical protein
MFAASTLRLRLLSSVQGRAEHPSAQLTGSTTNIARSVVHARAGEVDAATHPLGGKLVTSAVVEVTQLGEGLRCSDCVVILYPCTNHTHKVRGTCTSLVGV